VSTESAAEAESSEAVEIDAGLGGFEIASTDDDEGEAVELPMMETVEEDEAVELPMMDMGGEDEEVGEPLPMMGFDDETSAESSEALPTMDFDEDEEVGEPLPMMDIGDDGDAPELTVVDFAADAVESAMEEVAGGDEAGESLPGFDLPALAEDDAVVLDSSEVVADELESLPAAIEATVEDFETPTIAPASPETEAAVEAAVESESTPAEDPAPEEPAEPAAGGGGYVDFGAMILGDMSEKSTRFTVAYEEPSGDEEADFAKMLSQFKDKVSENLDSSDVRAHYDLGTAYKEMGLLDEAISSFQAALRASAEHLPTYEIMGQTFMEMGQPEAAVKSLERGLESASTVEDELVGIYYYLGRAYEELENRESAVEYYDRVFSLDINFADVTERLRDLR
jgi:tetratricopeptide (TPR) repeat protein